MGKFTKSGTGSDPPIRTHVLLLLCPHTVCKSQDFIYTTVSVVDTFSLSPCGEKDFSRLWCQDVACVVDMTSQPILRDTQERDSRDNNEFFKVK